MGARRRLGCVILGTLSPSPFDASQRSWQEGRRRENSEVGRSLAIVGRHVCRQKLKVCTEMKFPETKQVIMPSCQSCETGREPGHLYANSTYLPNKCFLDASSVTGEWSAAAIMQVTCSLFTSKLGSTPPPPAP